MTIRLPVENYERPPEVVITDEIAQQIVERGTRVIPGKMYTSRTWPLGVFPPPVALTNDAERDALKRQIDTMRAEHAKKLASAHVELDEARKRQESYCEKLRAEIRALTERNSALEEQVALNDRLDKARRDAAMPIGGAPDSVYLSYLKEEYVNHCAIIASERNKVDRLANALRDVLNGIVIAKTAPNTIGDARALLQELGK